MKSIESKYTKDQALNDILWCFSELSLNDEMRDFANATYFYLNTNDQTNLIVPEIATSGSSILTVASSGDYMLESLFNGAKNITCFDVNSIQFHASCLKLWALQTLSYEEFIGFFTDITSPYYLSPILFAKISIPFMDEPSFDFWDEYFYAREEELTKATELVQDLPNMSKKVSEEFYSDLKKATASLSSKLKTPINTTKDLLVNQMCCFADDMELDGEDGITFIPSHMVKVGIANPNNLGYLKSKENFEKTKANLKDAHITFIKSDLLDLSKKIKPGTNFDGIFLSNIPDYLSDEAFTSSISGLLTLIKNNGQISYYHQGNKAEWIQKTKVHRSLVRHNPNLKIILSDVETLHGNGNESPYDVKGIIRK